jgi:F0F1-type ATP synthase assembly protein I
MVRALALAPMPNPTPTSRPGDVAKSTREVYRTLSLSSVGLEMGISVILGLFAGRWADGKLGTTPWLLILGCFLGLAAGFKGVFRAMKESDRIAAENERERGGQA